jgi:hypothetical protein
LAFVAINFRCDSLDCTVYLFVLANLLQEDKLNSVPVRCRLCLLVSDVILKYFLTVTLDLGAVKESNVGVSNKTEDLWENLKHAVDSYFV